MDKHFVFGVSSFVFGVSSFVLMVLFSFYIATSVWDTDSKGEVQIAKRLTSPDNKYTATLWNDMGGGAAGWCFRNISIGKKIDSSKNQIEADEKVFKLNCGSEIRFNWIDESRLQIIYKFVEKGGKVFFQGKESNEKKVTIQYIEEYDQ